jgi:hypothetical protein
MRIPRRHAAWALPLALEIVFISGGALARENVEHVVSVICIEVPDERSAFLIRRQASASFLFPATCEIGLAPSPASPCATCLRDLIRDHDCGARGAFPSNPIVISTGPSTATLKYVFTCRE